MNEVQSRQLVSNFGAMEDKADEFLNPFTKLGTAINDLVIAFQGPLVDSLAGFASFLANNIGALTTAFTGIRSKYFKTNNARSWTTR